VTLDTELARRLPEEDYLRRWFAHREHLWPWDATQAAETSRWAEKTARAIAVWAHRKAAQPDPLERQEDRLLAQLHAGDVAPGELATFLNTLYPGQGEQWDAHSQHPRAVAKLWQQARLDRQNATRDRHRAADLPEFHQKLLVRVKKLLEAEDAVKALLTDRDIGWDLDQGIWDSLDFGPLLKAAAELEKEPALRRIAELLGRDYRAKSKPPVPPPLPPQAHPDPEPGKTEIRGVTFGAQWSEALSSELALLAFADSSVLFYRKAAEGELLSWDHFTAAPPAVTQAKRSEVRQQKNDRGPLVVCLDTSGSMRGKPEEVAKTAVLALVRVALEEDRPCFLINFSATVRTLEVTNLARNLAELIHFLEFSFHGGTDLAPALRETLRVLEDGRFRDADVLVCSDFAVPKIPAPIRQAVRRQQESRGTRFYSLTVSVRPLNDFLNIFDAGWVYNIHPYQTNGIAPESLEVLG
jgi:uncharacterized protein with von Willebrand factor type A (vWA) domain